MPRTRIVTRKPLDLRLWPTSRMERGNLCNRWLHSAASYHFMVKLIVRLYLERNRDRVFFFSHLNAISYPILFQISFCSDVSFRNTIIKAPITFDRIFFSFSFFPSFLFFREKLIWKWIEIFDRSNAHRWNSSDKNILTMYVRIQILIGI